MSEVITPAALVAEEDAQGPEPKTDEFELNMGPQHPSTHGVLRLVLKLDGEEVVGCEPVVGYLHRSIEKICENRTYTQAIPLTDRVDYVTSMTSNYVLVLAVERLMDIVPPPRAEYIRVIMSELNRIASHLLWLGTLALDLGATTPFLYAFRDREKILDLFEATCGQRLLYNYLRIGGLSFDLPEGWTGKCREFLDYFVPMITEMDNLLTDNVIFRERTEHLGVLTKEMAVAYGCTGPVLRGSDVRYDVRRNDPYSIYPELEFDVPVGKNGDIFDRYWVRVEEMRQSVRILRQCLDKIPRGNYKLPMNMRVEVPEGDVYSRIESARGDIACYLVGDGSDQARRVKFRTPSFSNLAVLPELLHGSLVADVVAITGSLDIVLPEIDR